MFSNWYCVAQDNDNQPTDTLHINIHHNETQYDIVMFYFIRGSVIRLSVVTLSVIKLECENYAY